MKKISPFGLLIFVVTVSFAFVDWIMSLEPHWFSTMYAGMFLVGRFWKALPSVSPCWCFCLVTSRSPGS